MKLEFFGAAKTVTGSCHLITLNDGYKILLECGLYQGREEDYHDFNKEWHFDPKEIDCMILSHAHIDHSGRIPKLVKDGFKGNIYCTSATRDLCSIMLLDSAFIQERDVEYQNKHYRTHKEPLYTVQDAVDCMRNFVCVEYDRWFTIRPELHFIFQDAGHILGSASVALSITEPGEQTVYFGFTGDIGRPNRPILKDPVPIMPVDYLICESTYGNKLHPDDVSNEEFFLKIIYETCVANEGKLIIPAFSIGRTQEIVHNLDKLENQGRLPHVDVFVDSPLALNATDLYRMHSECFDENMNRYIQNDPDPFGFNKLKYIRKVDDSKALNKRKEPCIIISASGMANAGRVKHHIVNNIGDSKCTILIAGFCADGTLGAELVKKPDTVKIYGKDFKVNARIEVMNSLSAHGDQKEMTDFLSLQNKEKLKKIFLVHGDQVRQEAFKEHLLSEGFKSVEIPSIGNSYNI